MILAVSACGGGSASETTSPAAPIETSTTAAPATTAEATTTTTAAATTTSAAVDAAPPELAGRWFTEFQGDRLTLSLTGTRYNVSVGGATGSGNISVDGNQIRFYEGPFPGDGFYEWAVDGDTLTFTMLDPPDLAGTRRNFLNGLTYTR